jgi:hypothetical protein
MELHNILKCYISIKPSNKSFGEECLDFFNENHFLIGWNMFDPEWDNEVQAEEIFKRLILIYNFSPSDENIVFVRGPKVIYFEDHQFVKLPPGGVFVHDRTKVEIDYEESE